MNTQQETNKKKPLQKIDFPWKVKFGLGPIKKLEEGKPEREGQYLKEPIAFIIKANYEVDIREDVKEGYIEYERDLGGQKDTVRLFNPKSKLLSFPIGNRTYRGWILDEREAVALPQDAQHDSLILKRIMEALMLNYEEYKSKRMKEWQKILLYLLGGIIILVLGMGMFNISFADIFGWETVQQVPQTVTYIIDANAMTGIGSI